MRLARLALAACLVYACLEGWARLRFDLQNPVMPAGIRANLGLDAYEAHKLKADYDGVSRSGIRYRTDAHGFRVGDQGRPASGESVVLGGDSRVFGLGLPYDQTVAGRLEADGLRVYQQAVPGGSPLFFLRDLADTGTLGALAPKPAWIFYCWDREDARNDRELAVDLRRPHPWWSPRRLKLALGGYAWSMAGIKAASFADREDDPAPAAAAVPDPPTPDRFADSAAALERLAAESRRLGAGLVLVYLPRRDELLACDGRHRDLLARQARRLGIPFLDGFEALGTASGGEPAAIDRLFLDPAEGIHFTAEGCRLLAGTVTYLLRSQEWP